MIPASLLVTAVLAAAHPAARPTAPADADIRTILIDRVETQGQAIGMVVGVIEPAGRRIVAHGRLARGDSRQLDGDTIFEIPG
jgi:hypothetical protein